MNLAENIYTYRKKSGMSQGDLAEALDVSRQSVSKWETGAAVPELDKLVKMSQIFDISVDELIGAPPRKTEEQAAAPEPPIVVYVDKPVLPRISRQTIFGIVLLIVSLLLALILAFDLELATAEILALTMPPAICGGLFLVTKNPSFYSGWILSIGYWIQLLVFVPRWEAAPLFLILGVLLVTAMVVLSILVHRRGILRIPGWVWVIGSLLLICAAVLLLINTVPPFWISSSSVPVGS